MGPIKRDSRITDEQRDTILASLLKAQEDGRWFEAILDGQIEIELIGPEDSETDVDGREVAEHAASTT